MDIDRFKQIINYSNANKKSIGANVNDFYSKMNMEQELLNLMQIVRPLFLEKGYLIIELPFSDKEIGAFCYKGDAIGYTVLNSSLPKVNVNFALCHEIYHIFYQETEIKTKVDLLSEHYYEHEEEFAANLFAGMLLMPEKSYKFMFRKFNNETQTADNKLAVLAKLMSYFQVPYMAALIRCYELDLLESGELLEKLIQIDHATIRNQFTSLWLDDAILKATRKDDYSKLEELVKLTGKDSLEKAYLNERTLKKVLQNMCAIYDAIKGE
ncbi:MAG: ImmA/IrrE family metallo-endopeptidase [Roseburia sp.]|nr:ImmA/IrrE family metallo-endopeptidase [Roseburia sp.]